MIDRRLHILDIERRAQKRFHAGELPREDFFAICQRAQILFKRRCWLERNRARRAKRIKNGLAGMRRVREVLAEGGTVLAIDTGFSQAGGLEELGLATFRQGDIHGRNLVGRHALYRIDGNVPHPRPHIGERTSQPFLFGSDEVLDQDALVREGRAAYDRADAVVIFSGHEDVRHIGVAYGEDKQVDLQQLDFLATRRRQRPSLSGFCEAFGIDARGWHNSGNDARYTLDLALRIAGDDRLLDGKERMISTSLTMHGLSREAIMAPSRVQIREAVKPAFSRMR